MGEISWQDACARACVGGVEIPNDLKIFTREASEGVWKVGIIVIYENWRAVSRDCDWTVHLALTRTLMYKGWDRYVCVRCL